MRLPPPFARAAGGLLLAAILAPPAPAADIVIPHAQTKPPNEPRTPAEAIRHMTVPEGFAVELVAAEPDVVNPVAMTIDERGRFWITESLEYPRRAAGPGKDRIKVLEDTDGDGRADKFTIFAEGLNIPSGIAVGHGGVWVGNAPDILFLQDADGDGRADKQEVVVTGFGRTDTHELPNSFTWGPDGWLYGLNGVFNHSHIVYPKSSPHWREDQPGWKFTFALFRIHPVTREFQVFCEGTSNPWGLAIDGEGSFFISACVIDHLWHLVETGYYHRQGGPYPPFTWKIESIVKHKHQKAAYCGIHYFDSDAFPAEYRGRLFMGNIHGGCVNVDKLRRDGSTYFATGEPDLLTANDAWFMPVVQKTGPDGALYVLDWYDRYHCYQDANRDPAGIDRLRGRLYRLRHKDAAPAQPIHLAQETDEQLLARLNAGNDCLRWLAQRLLHERLMQERLETPACVILLPKLAFDPQAPRRQRLHALWTLLSAGHDPGDEFLDRVLASDDATFRAWGVRHLGDRRRLTAKLREQVVALADDPSPDVRLQVAIAARKIEGLDPLPLLVKSLAKAGDDPLIPRVVWQNLHPLLETQGAAFVAAVAQTGQLEAPAFAAVLPRAVDRILAVQPGDPQSIAALFKLVAAGNNSEIGRACLQTLAQRVQSRELAGAQLVALRGRLDPSLGDILASGKHPLFWDAALLAASWQHPAALPAVKQVLGDAGRPAEQRLAALSTLVSANEPSLLASVETILADPQRNSTNFRGDVLAALGQLDRDEVGPLVVAALGRLEPTLRPRAIELLSQRKAWGKQLLAAVAGGQLKASEINVNQARKLLALGDAELTALVTKHWGTVRTERDPAREAFLAKMRQLIRSGEGDPRQGHVVYGKLCGQCHKIYGQGQDVGPDITSNGRASFEQLLSNVFDPSLVIGSAYQARTVLTEDGRVITGLLVEDSPQRVVLKVQGGKLETIARGDVAEFKVSQLSLMPEAVEKQFQPQEIIDLFAFLTLDRPPGDPQARPIPGTILARPRATEDKAQFNELVGDVLPGYVINGSGVGGVAVIAEHAGRQSVLRTHPLERGKASVLSQTFEIPAGKKARLELAVSHDPRGDWQLIVRAGGKTLLDKAVSPKTASGGWLETSVDLSPFAGQKVTLELLNQPTDWSYEFGFWSRADLIVE